jgi:hypothetical protein
MKGRRTKVAMMVTVLPLTIVVGRPSVPTTCLRRSGIRRCRPLATLSAEQPRSRQNSPTASGARPLCRCLGRAAARV